MSDTDQSLRHPRLTHATRLLSKRLSTATQAQPVDERMEQWPN
jgi:hypothetical protein